MLDLFKNLWRRPQTEQKPPEPADVAADRAAAPLLPEDGWVFWHCRKGNTCDLATVQIVKPDLSEVSWWKRRNVARAALARRLDYILGQRARMRKQGCEVGPIEAAKND